ncbi:sensor histidine kinase [Amycolatopsis acidicola]|uniref:Sensor histidine kinase n=1 Tax=Amycolatopsis acidicola TaxID=2596893 RepID=A0A5N0UUW5_9PSEU|nr:sensor histidine kinase [Amycolatopsis acidicola]KAA9155417.1 sensor histidine kinase [Amycolatopsis acidicola]
MGTGAAANHAGFRHEAMCYGSDEELVNVLVPFLLAGSEAGEPTLVSLGEHASAVVREALPPGAAVAFLDGGGVYARPATVIKMYRQLLAEHVAAGARRIRVCGEIPFAPRAWDWWARYEAVVGEAYGEFPLWAVCAYDTRTTPRPVLDDVARTHSLLAAGSGEYRASASFAPEAVLRERRAPEPDSLQYGPPVFELHDPSVMAVRRALAENHGEVLSGSGLADFQVAVSEVVTNAIEHGRPPVSVRMWRGAGRLVVTVTDRGDGPAELAAGLLPAPKAPLGGLGLWMAYQLCDHVTFGPGLGGGFSIRLTAGDLSGA